MTRLDTNTNEYKANSIWQLKNKLNAYEKSIFKLYVIFKHQ